MREIQAVVASEDAACRHNFPFVLSSERMQALDQMMAGGLDEGAITLCLLPGIGAKTAKQLKQGGIADIEDLALADPSKIAQLPRISERRAAQWVEQALERVGDRASAYRYRENQLKLYSLNSTCLLALIPIVCGVL
jgi:predicted flap endonuclease-1-like 5' DNA nuclease